MFYEIKHGLSLPQVAYPGNDRGPYLWTTAAKRMQRHFLAAE
jgi:hypothetical protein